MRAHGVKILKGKEHPARCDKQPGECHKLFLYGSAGQEAQGCLCAAIPRNISYYHSSLSQKEDFSCFLPLLSPLPQPFVEASVLRWKLNESKTPSKRSKSGFVQ